MIDYKHFSELEIKIGTITSVDVVPEADRLLRLMVDTGDAEPRQIVSGIREFFEDPQTLVGQQCPFLVNLEPRTIRGLESQGMILAVGDSSDFTLLHPAAKVPPGTPIS